MALAQLSNFAFAALCSGLVTLVVGLVGCDRGGEAVLPVRAINHWPMPPAGDRIPAPRGLTIGPNDQVVVIDNAGRLLIFDAGGVLQRQWNMPSNENGNAEGACWLADGRIAVADTHYHRVVFFDSDGNRTGTFGRHSDAGEPGTFRYPVSIVQDDDEHLYVSEYGGADRIQKFTRDGEFILAFGRAGTGPGQFQRAAGMAWHRGRIYIADASNGRVQIFADDGTFIEVLGAADGPLRFRFPYDVAIGPDDSLFVIEWGAGRVCRTTLDGRVLGRFGEPGSKKGQLRTPWGIDVDSKMRCRVADTENRRIVELVL